MCQVRRRTVYTKQYRLALVILGVVGDVLQGALMTGWPSLSLILKHLGDYSKDCDTTTPEEICPHQEEHFSLDWNTAVFAINFGPVITGYFLDRLGPRFISVTSTIVNALSLILLAHSPIKYIDTLPIATFGLGLGGFTYHMAQFYKINMFPRYKGTISSFLNAGYQVSACQMMLVYVIWSKLGSDLHSFRIILCAYAVILGLLIPLLCWLEADTPLDVSHSGIAVQDNQQHNNLEQALLQESDSELDRIGPIDQEQIFQEQILQDDNQSSSEIGTSSEERIDIVSDVQEVVSGQTEIYQQQSTQKNGVRLSPRWRWLNQQNFLTQITSPEAIGMCIYYTFSIVILQFYMGTARVQLEIRGDTNHFYANMFGPIQAIGFISIPIVAYLLDGIGYGAAFLAVLFIGILDSIFQTLPILKIQILTMIFWTIDRFTLNSAFYSIEGAIFGFGNFGKILAVQSAINGAIGFLQYPVLSFVMRSKNGSFLYVHIGQIVVLISLIPFCLRMMVWGAPTTQAPHRSRNWLPRFRI